MQKTNCFVCNLKIVIEINSRTLEEISKEDDKKQDISKTSQRFYCPLGITIKRHEVLSNETTF